MTAPPILTDRAALRRNRNRADPGALFLHDEAEAQIHERLKDVNRTFTAPLIVTGHPDRWRDVLPGARVIEDDPVLDAQPGAHDLALHVLSLHWADDPVGQIVQCRRALRADGLFLGIALGERTLDDLRTAIAGAEIAQRGGLSPRVAPMAGLRDLGALLQRAGLTLPVADAVAVTARYPNAVALMHDLRAMGEGNALAARDRRIPPRGLFARAAAAYPADADGRISATFDVICLTGWAPGPGQPQALRPGSATTRLADALGATETPAGDPALPRDD